MPISDFRMPSWPAPRIVSLCLIAAALAGLAWWTVALLEPLPRAAPAAASGASDEGGAREAAAWLAPGSAKLEVKVAGALAGGGRGAAVLSVNGGPPQAYAIGDALTHSARLVGIEAQALVVEQSGVRTRLPMPALPDAAGNGLTPAGQE